MRLACSGSASAQLDELVGLQGDVKRLSAASYQRLRGEIVERGMSFPIAVWLQPPDDTPRVIDGHQRVECLRRMRDEGWSVPPLPVCTVDAADEREAKAKLLAAMARYGEVDDGALASFVSSLDFDEAELERIVVPGVDLSALLETFPSQRRGESPEDDVLPEERSARLRQITLAYESAQFDEAVELLNFVKAERSFDTNNDAVLYLLRRYVEIARKKTNAA